MGENLKKVVMLAEQTRCPDGSILVKPVAVSEDREISTREAAAILGLHRQTIGDLCALGVADGGLKAWKTASKRNNAKWRISLQSVFAYREARTKQAGQW